jgi:hypothetical protein
MSDTAVTDPSRTVAELQRRLGGLAAELRARTAERDEALARQSDRRDFASDQRLADRFGAGLPDDR